MKRRNLIYALVALILTAGVVVTIVFAWYLNVTPVSDMKFNILQIDSLVALYDADDSNYNGAPDLLANDAMGKYHNRETNTDISYSRTYYTEKYSFNYFDQRYALSQDSSATLFNTLSITNACPSKVYTYKFEITNYIDTVNTLKFAFLQDNNINTSILKDFSVRIGVVNVENDIPTYVFGNWTNFCTKTNNEYTYSGLELKPTNNDIEVPKSSVQHGRLDLWLQIRIDSEATNSNLTEFLLPTYRIELSCEIADS